MQEIEGIGVEEGEDGDTNTKGMDIDEKAEGKGFKRKRTSKQAKIDAQLGQTDNIAKNGEVDTSRKNMLGSGSISNPFNDADPDSFVNKSSDGQPKEQQKMTNSIRKKKKNKGSKRF